MPKKTQKGAGNTDEENFLQLQQRVQAEQEMSKKKEETLTLFLKDKLQREERYTAVNRLKVMDDWRTTLRQTKAAELRREAEVMQQTSEREQDELDAVIQKLNPELLGAERQTAQVQCNHLQHLDRLHTQQERHVSWLQERWEGALEELRSRNHAEKKWFSALSEQRNQKFAEQVVVAKQRSSDMMEDYRRRHEKMMAFCESLMPLDGDESDELEELDNPGVTSLANSVCGVKQLQPPRQRLSIALQNPGRVRRSRGGLRPQHQHTGVSDGPHALLTSSRHQTDSVPQPADRLRHRSSTRRQILPVIQQKRSSAPKPPMISKKPVSFPSL